MPKASAEVVISIPEIGGSRHVIENVQSSLTNAFDSKIQKSFKSHTTFGVNHRRVQHGAKNLVHSIYKNLRNTRINPT